MLHNDENELFEELLQCLNKHLTIDEIVSADNKRIDNNIYWIVKEIDIIQSRNIYELANECKELAKYRGYYIHSSVGDASWVIWNLHQLPIYNVVLDI